MLRTPTVNFYLNLPGQLATQVIDVDSSATVDVRRKLTGE
jgi:hypothetical protein